MNLKEFDAKQFLLEKGERVGLGIALALMVAMLVFSLFMPSQGFFSGSPAAKADELADSTKKLTDQLDHRDIPDSEKPDTDKNRLIKLDTTPLSPSNYGTLPWFAPGSKENPARRPPKIYNIEESVARYAVVPVDTYLFNSDFSKIKVLIEDGKSVAKGGGPGGPNPFSMLPRGGNPMMSGRGGMMGGRNPMNIPMGSNLGGVSGTDTPEYQPTFVSFDKWNSQYLTAHQLQPLRMALVAASFPYRRQLEEFKNQLRLESLQAVLDEPAADNENEKSFRFLEILIERVEVDANDKEIGSWKKMDLRKDYEPWLQITLTPFQPENPKYDLVKFEGLAPPLLREFHARDVNPTMKANAMFGMPGGGIPPGGPAAQAEPPADEPKSEYPDVPALLPKLQDTLDKLAKVDVAQIAAPKANTKKNNLDIFRLNTAPPMENPQQPVPNPAGQPAGENMAYPEYCLVRFCDVTVEPNKGYRYRIKIKMANPNYKREDVASPAYKEHPTLESKEWVEIKDTVRSTPELYYYVVDERLGIGPKDPKRPQPPSAASSLWDANPSPDQVVFQLHRWVEQLPIGSRANSEFLPVGDWAIADRVLVGRGESVGRTVKVDLPVWRYAKNKFELPTEQPVGKVLPRNRSKITTGIPVDFNPPGAKGETILVDFEGGRSTLGKLGDTSRFEVLMLDPNGNLLARNSTEDKKDGKRETRRKEVFDRIEEVRKGKGNE